MEETIVTENKMGTMPVGKLLLQMSIPMVISMLVQSIYNIVDSMFVARISEEALTAVSLAFPIQNILIAFGVGIGVGSSALLSRFLGENSRERVGSVAFHGIVLAGITYVVFAILGLLFTDFFCKKPRTKPNSHNLHKGLLIHSNHLFNRTILPNPRRKVTTGHIPYKLHYDNPDVRSHHQPNPRPNLYLWILWIPEA